MESVRINISIPNQVFKELSEVVEPRGRSRFVSEAIQRLIREKRDLRLAAEYRDAADEMRGVNREMEGALSDGLD